MCRWAAPGMVLFLVLFAACSVCPVHAVDDEGPDTSGFEYDFDAFATELLDDPFAALSWGPPRYRWDPERYMDEGDRCAEKFLEYRTRFIDRAYVIYNQNLAGQNTALVDKNTFSENIFTDPDGVFIGTVRMANDPEADRSYRLMESYGNCIRKNYDAAMSLQNTGNYSGKADVWDRAAAMFETLGNKDRADESRRTADEYREAAAADSLLAALLPSAVWLAMPAVAGGWLLIRRRRW